MTHNFNSEHNPFMAIILWCMAQVSYILSISLSSSFDILFKGVSYITAIMILIINIKPCCKAIRGFFKKK